MPIQPCSIGQKPHRGQTCADGLKFTAKSELTNTLWQLTVGLVCHGLYQMPGWSFTKCLLPWTTLQTTHNPAISNAGQSGIVCGHVGMCVWSSTTRQAGRHTDQSQKELWKSVWSEMCWKSHKKKCSFCIFYGNQCERHLKTQQPKSQKGEQIALEW